MGIKPEHKKLAIVGGSYVTGSTLIFVGIFAGIFFGLSSFLAVAPANKKVPLFEVKAWGALGVGIAVGVTIGDPFSRVGARLISYGSDVLHENS
jgi:hypothetical protein